jgi:RNA 2',3'-cyclic 3'-phosphodiesterase
MKPTRTFIAIDPGKAVRDRLVALQENLAKSGADVKWVEHDNLHLTLLFLGEVDQRDLPGVCRAVADAAATQPAFAMTIEKAGAFPNARRPRTLWVGVGAGAPEVCSLHDAAETPLLALGCYRREERVYTPHLTLGRVRADRASDALGAALTKYAAWTAGETTVGELLVMGSELKSEGPEYTVLSRAKLGAK